MNLRFLTISVSAAGALILAACTVSETSGSGGTTSSSTGAGAAGGGTTSSSAAGVGGGTGGGGGSACQHCAEAITPPDGDPSKLCAGESSDLFDALAGCVCDPAQCGGDTGDCAATCKGMPETNANCGQCQQTAAMGPCNAEFGACAGDAP